MTQLVELRRTYKDIQAEGAEVLVIIPDTQAANKEIAQQVEAVYPLLSDKDQKAITAYNAADVFHPDTVRIQTYIIAENGIILQKTLIPSKACE